MSKCLSKIFGRATAIFGGKIGMTVGLSDDHKYAVVGLNELVVAHAVGEKIENDDNYGEQITLAFDSIKSINIFRNALDLAEICLKEGDMPENLLHGFVQNTLPDHDVSGHYHE